MKSSVYVVIMAGGAGTRFWPYSRNSKPKQFIDVLGTGKSLLQLTYDRFLSTSNKDNILVVTNDRYTDLVKEQLPDIDPQHILAEPDRKNTAPCIAYATYKIKEKDPNAVMVVTPADHAIFQTDKFNAVINKAIEEAKDSYCLGTVGIKPNRPETGYGYIQYLESDGLIKKVKTFTEKPELSMAKKFLDSGDFAWNAGIFVWSLKAIVKSFEEHLPDIAQVFNDGNTHYYSSTEQEYIDEVYKECQNISIDYGILERAKEVFVIQGDFDWSDLGSWNSLHELREKDVDNNIFDGEVVSGNSMSNNIVKSESNRVLVLDDLDGYLVGDFDDVLIICKKDKDAEFREYVAKVKHEKGEKYI